MNYFEYFGLEISFHIDKDLLRRKFLIKSKELHPDFNNDNADKLNELSAINNKAYQVLKDEESLISHVLEIYETDTSKNLPSDFLMLTLEINEEIEEAKSSSDSSKLSELSNRVIELEEGFKKHWDNLPKDTINDHLLEAASDYIMKLRYIRRMKKLLNDENEI
jgi:molecular chaperone HscB